MAVYIPLSNNNIYIAAALAEVEVEEVVEQLNTAYSRHYDATIRHQAAEIMGYDEQWYDETMAKIDEISKTLSEDMDRKECEVALYGWVRPKNGQMLTIIMSKNDIYTHAYAVKIILHQPYLYDKINSWD
jgi:hypothetical protein